MGGTFGDGLQPNFHRYFATGPIASYPWATDYILIIKRKASLFIFRVKSTDSVHYIFRFVTKSNYLYRQVYYMKVNEGGMIKCSQEHRWINLWDMLEMKGYNSFINVYRLIFRHHTLLSIKDLALSYSEFKSVMSSLLLFRLIIYQHTVKSMMPLEGKGVRGKLLLKGSPKNTTLYQVSKQFLLYLDSEQLQVFYVLKTYCPFWWKFWHGIWPTQ